MSIVSVLINVSPVYNGTKVSYFSVSREFDFFPDSVSSGSELFGVITFAHVIVFSSFTKIFFEA